MLVVIFIIAVIIYRTLASIYLFSNPHTRPIAQILASSSGAMVFSLQYFPSMAVFSHLTLKQHKNHGIAVFLDVVTSIFGTYPYQLVGPLVILLDFHCVFQISIGLFGWVLPFLYVDDSIFLTFLPQPMTLQKKVGLI